MLAGQQYIFSRTRLGIYYHTFLKFISLVRRMRDDLQTFYLSEAADGYNVMDDPDSFRQS